MEIPIFSTWFNPLLWVMVGAIFMLIYNWKKRIFLMSISAATFVVVGILFIFKGYFNEESGVNQLSILVSIWAFLSVVIWIGILIYKRKKAKSQGM